MALAAGDQCKCLFSCPLRNIKCAGFREGRKTEDYWRRERKEGRGGSRGMKIESFLSSLSLLQGSSLSLKPTTAGGLISKHWIREPLCTEPVSSHKHTTHTHTHTKAHKHTVHTHTHTDKWHPNHCRTHVFKLISGGHRVDLQGHVGGTETGTAGRILANLTARFLGVASLLHEHAITLYKAVLLKRVR